MGVQRALELGIFSKLAGQRHGDGRGGIVAASSGGGGIAGDGMRGLGRGGEASAEDVLMNVLGGKRVAGCGRRT